MGRRPGHVPLRVYLNNRRVGTLRRDSGGAISFDYHDDWLAWSPAMPISLSLPLRETAYRGAPVAAVFDNLLPDSEALLRPGGGKGRGERHRRLQHALGDRP